MIEKLKKIYTLFFFCIFRIIPLKNRVVFSSFSGKRYGDNPKLISELLYKEYPNLEQIWLLKEFNMELPEYVKQVKWGSIYMIYALATSKVWVDSHTKPTWVRKRKNQFFIETWHGGLGIKKIAGDVKEKLSKEEIKRIKHNSNLIDILISNSDWLTDIYRRAFWYDGKIEKIGYPKDDYLLNLDLLKMKNKVCDYYGIDRETKLLLYAPTMRDNPSIQLFHLDTNRLIDELTKRFGGSWKILFRLHPVNEKLIENYDESSNIINTTKYLDILELIGASDVILTDYSSCIFDATLINKNAMIYAPDKINYVQERGFYLQLEELPFLIAENEAELYANISKFDEIEYQKAVKKYYEKMGYIANGNSTEIIVELINKKMRGE